jgi:hypothetical protein
MPRIKRKGKKGARSAFVAPRVADALIRHGTFEIAYPISSAEPEIAKAHAAGGPRTAPIKEREEAPQAQVSLEGMTKAQLVAHLRASGEKVDPRNNKDELLKQAKRYQRRDMRAEP